MEDQKKESEKMFRKSKNSFIGYYYPTNPLIITIIGIFAALICVLTTIIRIPVPTTSGYINIGDLGVMFSGLLFGPFIGGLAGGIGSGLADLIGYPSFTIPTLIIKGLEGFIVGLISNPRKIYNRLHFRDIVAVIIGGIIIVLGYFIVEAYIFSYGIVAALVEVPGNMFQFIFGAIGSILLVIAIRKNLNANLPQVFDKIYEL